jgi:hypothetical protein
MFTILCDMWLLIQMITLIRLSCWLYGEIRKPAIEQQIAQATADLDTEVKVLSDRLWSLHFAMTKNGLKFQVSKNGHYTIHDAGFFEDMKDLKNEKDEYAKEAFFYEKEIQRMLDCAKAAGYLFITENKKTVKMVPIPKKTRKTTNDIMMY